MRCINCGREINKTNIGEYTVCDVCKNNIQKMKEDNHIWNMAIDRVIRMCYNNSDFGSECNENHFIEELKKLRKNEV